MRRQVEVAVTADAAWSVIGRPELLHHWFPGIVSCRVDGDNRVVTTAAGVSIPEQIVTIDSLQHRFQYRITAPMFTRHLATVDVIDLGDGTCLVVYATDAEPAGMALVIGGGSSAALDELKRQMETGTGPGIDALAQGARV